MKETIVIVSPIHGFSYPKITFDFVKKLPKGNNQVVLMATRAGMRIGNYVTPGLTGIAFFVSKILLKSKGYRVIWKKVGAPNFSGTPMTKTGRIPLASASAIF